MAERETKEVKVGEHTLVLKAYLTARETLPIFKDKTLEESDKAHKLAEAVIVSLDGSTDGILDRILDFPLGTYTGVLNAVKEVADADFQSAK